MPKRKASAEPEHAAGQHGRPPKRLEPVREDPDEDEAEGESGESDGEDGSDSDGSSAPEASSNDDDSSEDDDVEDAEEELTSHFNARAAEEDDFHGLKKLLSSYLSGQDFSCSDLVDAIIQQQAVGMIVTSGEDVEEEEEEQGEQVGRGGARRNGSAGTGPSTSAAAAAAEDDDGRGSIWAVLTVLNTQQHKDKRFMKEVREHAMGLCKDVAAREQLAAAWDAPGTGLLVSECVLGLPPKLAPPSLRALAEDLRRAAAEGGGAAKEARKAFQLQRFVLLPMVLVETGGAKGQAAGTKGQAAGAKGQAAGAKGQAAGAKGQAAGAGGAGIGPEQVFYMRPEHEYLHRHSSWSQLAACHKPPRNDGFTEYRLLMVVAADKLVAVQRDLDAEIGAAA